MAELLPIIGVIQTCLVRRVDAFSWKKFLLFMTHCLDGQLVSNLVSGTYWLLDTSCSWNQCGICMQWASVGKIKCCQHMIDWLIDWSSDWLIHTSEPVDKRNRSNEIVEKLQMYYITDFILLNLTSLLAKHGLFRDNRVETNLYLLGLPLGR